MNDELDKRVDECTRELKQANLQLEATTKQLIMSEKLAAIGEFTAGVAHEINNPIAVMQGNLDVLRSSIGDRAESVDTELTLLDEQIHRINIIVTKLQQFAKPEEYADYVASHKPQDVVSDYLPLVKHLLQKGDISVERDDAANRQIAMNRTELQQILVNLLVNAIHAMPDGGRLRVRTRTPVRITGIELGYPFPAHASHGPTHVAGLSPCVKISLQRYFTDCPKASSNEHADNRFLL